MRIFQKLWSLTWHLHDIISSSLITVDETLQDETNLKMFNMEQEGSD